MVQGTGMTTRLKPSVKETASMENRGDGKRYQRWREAMIQEMKTGQEIWRKRARREQWSRIPRIITE